MRQREGKLSLKKVEVEEKGIRYTTWRLDGYDMNGKRVRFSSKDRQTAQLKLIELQAAIHNAAVETPVHVVHTRLSDARLRDAEAAIELLGDRGVTLLDAVRAALDDGGLSVRLTPIALSAAITQYLSEQKDRVRPTQFQVWKSQLERFCDFTRDALLTSISTETVKNYVATLRGKDAAGPAKPATRNNARAELHTFFNWAIGKSWMTDNPAKRVPKATVDRSLIEVLSVPECRELMAYAASFREGRTARFFALALFAGIRPEEIDRLSKDPRAIDLEENVIRISEAVSKVHEARPIEIQPNLKAWLTAFPTGTMRGDNSSVVLVRRHFGLQLRQRDLPRHTFISCRVKASGHFADTAIESGNSESIIRKHYYHAVSKADALAFWEIMPPA